MTRQQLRYEILIYLGFKVTVDKYNVVWLEKDLERSVLKVYNFNSGLNCYVRDDSTVHLKYCGLIRFLILYITIK